jgi:hypothetical protein
VTVIRATPHSDVVIFERFHDKRTFYLEFTVIILVFPPLDMAGIDGHNRVAGTIRRNDPISLAGLLSAFIESCSHGRCIRPQAAVNRATPHGDVVIFKHFHDP